MVDRKCENCMWYEKLDHIHGECRVKPPEARFGFPTVIHNTWCRCWRDAYRRCGNCKHYLIEDSQCTYYGGLDLVSEYDIACSYFEVSDGNQ